MLEASPVAGIPSWTWTIDVNLFPFEVIKKMKTRFGSESKVYQHNIRFHHVHFDKTFSKKELSVLNLDFNLDQDILLDQYLVPYLHCVKKFNFFITFNSLLNPDPVTQMNLDPIGIQIQIHNFSVLNLKIPHVRNRIPLHVDVWIFVRMIHVPVPVAFLEHNVYILDSSVRARRDKARPVFAVSPPQGVIVPRRCASESKRQPQRRMFHSWLNSGGF